MYLSILMPRTANNHAAKYMCSGNDRVLTEVSEMLFARIT